MKEEIVSGERLQELCDIYYGLEDDFRYNPRIFSQTSKHFNLDFLTTPWNNPSIIFCYSHRLPILMEKRHLLTNSFKLVAHNSDENIIDKYRPLIDDPKLIAMYSQNICIEHPKLSILPIGIANTMWAHGNLDILSLLMTFQEPKTLDFYFFFNIGTNPKDRSTCYDALTAKGMVFDKSLPHKEFMLHLSKHKYAICPEGNGIDSHRIWECYYLGVIPIVHTSVFTIQLRKILPCILLDNWSDFDSARCLAQYKDLYAELQSKRNILNLSYYKNKIQN